jgi:hypothetical protein
MTQPPGIKKIFPRDDFVKRMPIFTINTFVNPYGRRQPRILQSSVHPRRPGNFAPEMKSETGRISAIFVLSQGAVSEPDVD